MYFLILVKGVRSLVKLPILRTPPPSRCVTALKDSLQVPTNPGNYPNCSPATCKEGADYTLFYEDFNLLFLS